VHSIDPLQVDIAGMEVVEEGHDVHAHRAPGSVVEAKADAVWTYPASWFRRPTKP
jgi:hypothetical protein